MTGSTPDALADGFVGQPFADGIDNAKNSCR
jgi:hypothetical protein